MYFYRIIIKFYEYSRVKIVIKFRLISSHKLPNEKPGAVKSLPGNADSEDPLARLLQLQLQLQLRRLIEVKSYFIVSVVHTTNNGMQNSTSFFIFSPFSFSGNSFVLFFPLCRELCIFSPISKLLILYFKCLILFKIGVENRRLKTYP